MWAGYVMHVDAIIFYLSIREGDKAETLQAHGGSEAGSGRFETARAELRSSRGFEKMAILRTKIPEDKWNESLLMSKHSMHLSDHLTEKNLR